MSALRIRHASAADAAALARNMADWFLAAYGHSSDEVNTAAFVAANFDTARQAAEIADPDIVTLLVEADGAMVGYSQLRFATRAPDCVSGAHPAELGRFYFAPAFHGRGAAAELMQEVCRIACERGRRRLWLLVWQEAPQAIRFYEKHGFTKVGTAVFLVGDDRKADWVLCKPLDEAS